MNSKINTQTLSIGTFAYKMARREHNEIATLAQRRRVTVSGLIRGLLRDWHHAQACPASYGETAADRKKGGGEQ